MIATIAMNATKEKEILAKVAEYITRANYGIVNGNFELDYSTGQVRYKVYTYCKGLKTIPEEMVEKSILTPARALEFYGNGLVAMMMFFLILKQK